MDTPSPPCEEMERELLAKVSEARHRYPQDRTPESRAALRVALQQFADWALRGQSPHRESR